MPPRAPAPSPSRRTPPDGPMPDTLRDALRDALLHMARERGVQASLCPSEVARQVAAHAG
ncbi:MAG: DUF3253 domain-containing protein, partial [Burkholderiaceae bacterium]